METNKLKFGWCETSIDPKRPISLAGQFFERVTEEVETPLTVTALAVDNGIDHSVFVSCDLISIGANLVALVRENLKGKVDGLDLNKIIISAIHTHTSFKYERDDFAMGSSKDILLPFLPEGSVYKPVADSGTGMDPHDALVFLADRIALAVKTAWESRAEGYYGTGFGRAAVGFNRRMKYDDGKAKLYGNVRVPNFIGMEGSTDSGIEILFTFDKDKKVTGAAVNVACPSQVVEMKNFMSADYWGKVRILLREHFGEDLKVLSLCSAAGDIAPRDMVRWRGKVKGYLKRNEDPSMLDIEGTWKIGKRIAREVIDAYDDAVVNLKDSDCIMHSVDNLKLPLRFATETEYKEALRSIKEYFRDNPKPEYDFLDVSELFVYTGTIARYEFQKNHNIVPAEVHSVRLGDVAFVTAPGEYFVAYGDRIRGASRASQTFIIQLACNSYSYIPTEEAEKGSHYSAYISSGAIGHEGGNMIVRTHLDNINEMFKDVE